MSSIIVTAIHVGLPQVFHDVESKTDKSWSSGIIKSPVDAPVLVGMTNLAGDGQADLMHHGGVDKAVLAYAGENYALWREEFADVKWQAGAFGENLTLSGVLEAEACIGDVYRVGDCLLQISQPRQPCWKLSRRWKLPKLAVRVQQTGRTGWYFRVLQEGVLKAGQEMTLRERPHNNWTVQRANRVMFAQPRSAADDAELARCPALSMSWRATLSNR